MNLSDLEILVCLAEEGSFSRVAEKLNRSQPAVSQAIRRLEETFEVQLLDRTSRRAVLTGAGTSLVSYAGRMLQLWGGAVKTMAERRNGKRGVLRLAANGLLCDYLLPPLLEAFRLDHPHAKIEVVQCAAAGIPTALLDQDLDFGFLSYAPSHRDIETQVLFRDDLVLAVPPNHHMARSTQVCFQQLAGESFLAHSASTPSRKRLEYQFGQEGVALRVAMELPSLEALKRFVAAGAGVAILPRLCLERELKDGSLVAPRMKAQPIGRDIRVAFRRTRMPSPLAGDFLDLLTRRFKCRAA
jgi:DNA-binding transcriptional LysR family regulator